MKRIPKIYFLLLLTALAGSLGMFYNYGMVTGGLDETLKIHSVLKFFRDFSLYDQFSSFMPMALILEIPLAGFYLLSYLVFGFGDISQLKELVIVDTYKFVPFFRLNTIIFGLIAVFVFYKLCLEVFKKKRPAFVASFLFVTSLIFIQQIHIAGAWMEQVMFILISLYYFFYLLKKEKWRPADFLIAGLLVLFSFEIEFVGLIVLAPFFWIYLKKRKETKIKNEALNLFLFFTVIVLGIFVFAKLSPVTFSHYFAFANKAREMGLAQTVYGQDILGRVFGFFEILFLLEPALFILSLFGLGLAFKKDRFLFKIFGSYLLVYYLILGPLMGGFTERRVLPLIPVLAVFAAFLIEFLLEKFKEKNLQRFVYAGLLIFLINPIVFDSALLKDSSYISARNWVFKNIPADSRILDMCWLELRENKEVLELIKKDYPELLTTKRKYLLDNPSVLESGKNYFVIRENEIKLDGFQYLIVCFFNDEKKKELLAGFEEIKKTKVYNSLEGRKGFKATDVFILIDFSDLKNSGIKRLFNLPYHGPHFEIYQLSDNIE